MKNDNRGREGGGVVIWVMFGYGIEWRLQGPLSHLLLTTTHPAAAGTRLASSLAALCPGASGVWSVGCTWSSASIYLPIDTVPVLAVP